MNGLTMAVEDHPLYEQWRQALDRLIEAEQDYYAAVMSGQTDDDLQPVARALDEAREKYREIANRIG